MLVFIAAVNAPVCAQPNPNSQVNYRGAMDGSAAVAIDATTFAAASDEDSIIRLYRRDAGGDPVQQFDLGAFLQVDPRAPETDIEAAARIGGRIYWITSHGRNKNGKARPGRQRFFATDITTNFTGHLLAPVGKAYHDLLGDLVVAPQLKEFDFAAAARLAPKEPGALNIEGLAATPDNHLLIGFRNPIPGGRALLVPLLNPDAVIAGERARLGTPVQLELGGLGIRDVTLWQSEYLILAGPIDGGGPFKLFRWGGGARKPRALSHVKLKGFNPESLIVYPDQGLRKIQLLSDDSDATSNAAATTATREFRSIWVSP